MTRGSHSYLSCRCYEGTPLKSISPRPLNAGLVVLNVIMTESDRTGGDLALANALKNYPVVLGSVPAQKNKNIPRNPGSAVLGPEWLDQIIT